MEIITDLIEDALATAPLSAAQRETWESVRAELLIARNRIQELETRLVVLERQSKEDDAQPVLTRPEFNREVARMLAFDERYGGVSSVLFFDFENVGEIMSQNGRAAGDSAIRAVCDALAHNVRRSDIVGRLDTDSFGVLLARCPNPAAWAKAEKLGALLFKVVSSAPGLLTKPIISYGAYTFQEKEDLAIGLQQAADSVTRTV